jgi:hypothetical protein
MTYGLLIDNGAGEIVVSSDSKGRNCVGRGVLQGSVVQPTGSPTAGGPGRVSGYSIYRFSHPGPITVALDLPLNKRVGVISIAQPVAGTWDVKVHCGDTPDANDMDTVEYPIDVWAFGEFTSLHNGYGLAIYDDAGNLAWDFSRPHVLFPRDRVLLTGGSAAILALTRPAAVGTPTTRTMVAGTISFNTKQVVIRRGAWKRTSGTSISDVLYTEQTFRVFGPDPIDPEGDVLPSSCFIVEGSTLP